MQASGRIDMKGSAVRPGTNLGLDWLEPGMCFHMDPRHLMKLSREIDNPSPRDFIHVINITDGIQEFINDRAPNGPREPFKDLANIGERRMIG